MRAIGRRLIETLPFVLLGFLAATAFNLARSPAGCIDVDRIESRLLAIEATMGLMADNMEIVGGLLDSHN